MAEYRWVHDTDDIDWDELSTLYRVAPLGDKPPDALRTVFGNSRFVTFVYDGDDARRRRAGAGRRARLRLHRRRRRAPGPPGSRARAGDHRDLVAQSAGHKKIILYANPGKEGFYAKLGFLPMNTAMAVWHDPAAAIASALRPP